MGKFHILLVLTFWSSFGIVDGKEVHEDKQFIGPLIAYKNVDFNQAEFVKNIKSFIRNCSDEEIAAIFNQRQPGLCQDCQCKTKLAKTTIQKNSLQAEATVFKSNRVLQTLSPALNTTFDKSQKLLTTTAFERVGKVLNILSDVCIVVDSASAIFNLVFLMVPKGDSAELAYMKNEFHSIDVKLDSILQKEEQTQKAIDLLSLTKDINLAYLNTVKSHFNSMLRMVHIDIEKGVFTQDTKHEVELFMQEIENGELLAMTNTLIWAMIEPKKISYVKTNLFKALALKEGNDCSSVLDFSPSLVVFLRDLRGILDFYYQTQLGKDSPINWEYVMPQVLLTIYEEMKTCIERTKTSALEDLKHPDLDKPVNVSK